MHTEQQRRYTSIDGIDAAIFRLPGSLALMLNPLLAYPSFGQNANLGYGWSPEFNRQARKVQPFAGRGEREDLPLLEGGLPNEPGQASSSHGCV